MSVMIDMVSVIMEQVGVAAVPRSPSSEPGARSRSAAPAARLSAAPGAFVRRRTSLHVAVIGGLTRTSREWQRAGAALGVIVEHHDGITDGCRAAALAAMVRRADVVVTITVPNSHNAVAIARRVAESHGRVFLLVKRLSPRTLAAVVADALAVARAQELPR